MSILNSVNTFSKALLGVGLVDAWKQAPHTKAASQKAQRLAQKKHILEAVTIAEKAIAAWSSKPGFWERLICLLLLGNILEQFTKQLKQWRRQVAEVDKLSANAKTLLLQDTGNPLETQVLSGAIAVYRHCTKIIHDDHLSQAINQCQQELQRRQNFQRLVTQAESQVENKFFKTAIATYHEAEQLYPTESVKGAIATCETQVQQEEIYNSALQTAQQASRAGRLHSAIALLALALTNFKRSDGQELLQQLQLIVKGKEQFPQGLTAEKAGDLKEATSLYKAAQSLLPDSTECQIRLGLVAIKTRNWATALSHLESIRGEQAAYLRGFTYVQRGNLQQADREWQSLSHPEIKSQREILKSLSQQQCLRLLQKIEQLVKDRNLASAKAVSAEFRQQFGFDQLVESNLNEHIQPCLEAAIWQSANWGIVADKVEKNWISQPDITTLHNWAVATYYRAKSDVLETRHFTSLHDLIIALSTALANLTHDPALKDVPWLGTQAVDLESISGKLKQRMEEAIDQFKDQDVNKYLQLRDHYRLEMVSLRLMSEQKTKGMKVKNVCVTPSCYNRYFNHWRDNWVDDIEKNQNIFRSLYTPWGLAVAACLEGDTQRAIQLKPTVKTSASAELFAQKFVAYHEGCYQLMQHKWREAMVTFKQASLEIKASMIWQKEIDRLCSTQRQVISEFREHLEFAQLWYDLLGSQPARSYLADYRAEQLREKLIKQQVLLEKALQELRDIKQIDELNPVVLDLIERVEFTQEIEEIDRLLKRQNYEDVVRKAKKSRHDRVRFTVANFFIDILMSAVKKGDLSNYQEVQQVGRWAYEICPDEPAFQEIYRSLRLQF